MRIESLSLFLAVVRTGSISAAAKACHLSQPALSEQIKQLEIELNKKLFERCCSGNKLEITPAGKTLYYYAQQITALKDKAFIEMHRNDLEKQNLIIGTGLSGGTYIAPNLIKNYTNYYPNMTVKLHMSPGKLLLQQLRERKYDFIITSIYTDDPDFFCLPFYNDPLQLIVPKTFNIKDTIKLQNLFDFPFIIREEGSLTRDLLISNLEKCKFGISNFRTLIEVCTNQAIIQGVEAGLGCGFVPASSIINDHTRMNYKVISVRGLTTMRTIHLITLTELSCENSIQSFFKFATSDIWKSSLLGYI